MSSVSGSADDLGGRRPHAALQRPRRLFRCCLRSHGGHNAVADVAPTTAKAALEDAARRWGPTPKTQRRLCTKEFDRFVLAGKETLFTKLILLTLDDWSSEGSRVCPHMTRAARAFSSSRHLRPSWSAFSALQGGSSPGAATAWMLRIVQRGGAFF